MDDSWSGVVGRSLKGGREVSSAGLAHSPDLRSDADGSSLVSSSPFLLPRSWQLPSRRAVGLPKRALQCHTFLGVMFLLFCARLIFSLNISLFLQCTHMDNLCMVPHRLHSSSFWSGQLHSH